ncbi:cupin domain-containing protein [Cupriavidus basilensis]|uniref:cupin domain-containing protein n=1 Tax=Cupriavidus basilensis TaxID=68895 RepID=UPI0005BDCC96|nr:cupin domain-containing protein [Cupriavidus basilensis]
MAELNASQMSDADARRSLDEELGRFNCRVHQPSDPPLFTRDPQSPMMPLHWRWSDLAPLLERIGGDLKLEAKGNRRTLRLTNPGLPYGTTPTFWGSIQVILPGEVATTHRHVASALRFIMKGNGAFTTVDGEEYAMNEGDLVITPAMTWHDHVHRGDEPMIWLDVLDISLVRAMHATFFEGYSSDLQAVSEYPHRSYQQFGSGIMRPVRPKVHNPVNPLLAYPADRALAALSSAAELPADPYCDTQLEYQNPATGQSALPTISTRLQRLRPNSRCLPQRHTGSVLNYVIGGSGITVVNGQRFQWGPGDFIAIPPWSWYEHALTSQEPATLFQVNDIPALRALGLYREEFAASE